MIRLVEDERPELVLLDLMLPGTDGIELMKDILDVADVPVIFLSAYGREEQIARAFDTGAADYVVKPFYAKRRVVLAGRLKHLTPIEYRVLAELSANAGRVLTYERILSRVWGGKGDDDVRPMRTIVSKLRRKLGDSADNPTYIFTEPRVGFRMPEGEA